MKNRRIAWAGVVVLLALAACLAAWLWLARPGTVRLANHWHLQGRETLAEVEAILGGPPGDYSTTPGNPGATRFRLNTRVGDRSRIWISDEGIVIVHFDEEGRYDGSTQYGPGVCTPGPLDRLRRWLGW